MAEQTSNPAATGYVLVFQYHDRSGILGAFGPYATREEAAEAEWLLKNMPLASGMFETGPSCRKRYEAGAGVQLPISDQGRHAVIPVLVFAAMAVGLFVGLIFGLGIGVTRTKDALKLARYRDAIALADDLIKTPDALDLRDRAQKILAAHRAANPTKES